MEKTTMINKKREKLIDIIKSFETLMIAFSGGVDSTLLLHMACKILGNRVVAITADWPVHPRRETRQAISIARAMNVRHIVLHSEEIGADSFVLNPIERCYICKTHLFVQLKEHADRLGIGDIAHGANVDDFKEYRPGHKAADEFNIVAPLVSAGFTKADVRLLAKDQGLDLWHKPAMACLATRIPYGEPITREKLAMVESAENTIMDAGFTTCRVRHYGPVARIEVLPSEFDKMMVAAVRRHIVERLHDIGYQYVTMDLDGYVSGSMDRLLPQVEDREG
ncbi:MAG: ATP-dependent sacrificial sulfur transferase LarE [Desulfobacteraceae bacterium]|nr:ATP-dependent sacrificial sulfur transferase LarE [Desulfobacteraceae bacterium]